MPQLKLTQDGSYTIEGLSEEQVHTLLYGLAFIDRANPTKATLEQAWFLHGVLDNDYYSEQPTGE